MIHPLFVGEETQLLKSRSIEPLSGLLEPVATRELRYLSSYCVFIVDSRQARTARADLFGNRIACRWTSPHKIDTSGTARFRQFTIKKDAMG